MMDEINAAHIIKFVIKSVEGLINRHAYSACDSKAIFDLHSATLQGPQTILYSTD